STVIDVDDIDHTTHLYAPNTFILSLEPLPPRSTLFPYTTLFRSNPNGKIPTPNVDRLAAQGMIFTDAHSSSSVCTPTRYGILTGDRKSTRLNSSHVAISYAVFCLKKKNRVDRFDGDVGRRGWGR